MLHPLQANKSSYFEISLSMKIRSSCVILICAGIMMKTIYICYLCFSSQDSFQNVLPSHNFSIVLATDGHANIDNISLKYSALSTLIADQHAVTQSVRFQLLTESVIDKIKTYVFFIGMARSGHSIVAAVLDAHPHIVISDE